MQPSAKSLPFVPETVRPLFARFSVVPANPVDRGTFKTCRKISVSGAREQRTQETFQLGALFAEWPVLHLRVAYFGQYPKILLLPGSLREQLRASLHEFHIGP